jgi:hypothetical protein
VIVERDPRRRGIGLVAHERAIVRVDEAVRRAEHDRRTHDRLRHAAVTNVDRERRAVADPGRRSDHELLSVARERGRLPIDVHALDLELLQVEVEAREVLRRSRGDLVESVEPVRGRVV